uniref:SCAN box domain-containing protein n=1 Tax=Pseudonaja textilis TaxID=8673 RepID=A0A670Z784_PSETE
MFIFLIIVPNFLGILLVSLPGCCPLSLNVLLLKAAILREEALSREKIRRRFRQFGYWQADGPRAVYAQLRDLCRQWLKTEKHSKEQIVELLVLEQFLAILPPEMRSWVCECSMETCAEAVALVEDFLSRQQEARRQEKQAS